MDISQISEGQYYGALGIAIGIATLVVTLQKVFKNFRKEREERAAVIIQMAKEGDSQNKALFEAKLTVLDDKIKALEISINKDMDHLKETYSAEVKVLGEKIETLRDELRNQHSQMVTLLSKLIESQKP